MAETHRVEVPRLSFPTNDPVVELLKVVHDIAIGYVGHIGDPDLTSRLAWEAYLGSAWPKIESCVLTLVDQDVARLLGLSVKEVAVDRD